MTRLDVHGISHPFSRQVGFGGCFIDNVLGRIPHLTCTRPGWGSFGLLILDVAGYLWKQGKKAEITELVRLLVF